jgi:hypothetical protein
MGNFGMVMADPDGAFCRRTILCFFSPVFVSVCRLNIENAYN